MIQSLNLNVEIPDDYVLLTKEEYLQITNRRYIPNPECTSETNHINLFVARKERQLKQKDVAKKLGIHSVTYSRKERGELDFTLPEAFILAEMFNTTVDELFKK